MSKAIEMIKEEINIISSKCNEIAHIHLENFEEYIKELDKKIEDTKEEINHFNFKEEFDKENLKEYEYNSYDELNRATLKFIEKDKQCIKKLKNI